MASGGERSGRPGAQYGQRSDLQAQPRTAQPVRVAPGQQYGRAEAQREAQRSIPLPGQKPFARPTERPDEPITAGLPIGAGPGPEALAPIVAPRGDDVVAALRAAYQLAPSDDLLDLLIAESLR